MSAHEFERATLLRASAALHGAREELLEIEGLGEQYGTFLDRVDEVRNRLIDRIEELDGLIVVPCKTLDARFRCATAIATVGTCEQLPLESLGGTEAAE